MPNRLVSLLQIANCSGESCSNSLGLRSITNVLIDPRKKDVVLVGSDAGAANETSLDSFVEFLRIAKQWSRLKTGYGANAKARPWQTLEPPKSAGVIFDSYNVYFQPSNLYDSAAGSVWLDADIFLKYMTVQGFDGVPSLTEIQRQHLLDCDVDYDPSHVGQVLKSEVNYYFANPPIPSPTSSNDKPVVIEWKQDKNTFVWNGALNTSLRLEHGKAFGPSARIADEFTQAVNARLGEIVRDAPILQDSLNTLQLWDVADILALWSQNRFLYRDDESFDFDSFVDSLTDRLVLRYRGGHFTPRTVNAWAESRGYGRQCHIKHRVDGEDVFVEFVAGEEAATGGFSASSRQDAVDALNRAHGEANGPLRNGAEGQAPPVGSQVPLEGRWKVNDSGLDACPGSVDIERTGIPLHYRGIANFTCEGSGVNEMFEITEEYEVPTGAVSVEFVGSNSSNSRYSLDTYDLTVDDAGTTMQGLSTDNEALPSSITLTKQ